MRILQSQEENMDILDELALPRPENGEDVSIYSNRVREMFKDVKLPEEYDDDIFHWLYDDKAIAHYLERRFRMLAQEVHYWRMIR